jgi:hypothetical protein
MHALPTRACHLWAHARLALELAGSLTLSPIYICRVPSRGYRQGALVLTGIKYGCGIVRPPVFLRLLVTKVTISTLRALHSA